MEFTREPVIETVITPKEGCKLVVRSSKSTGQEEYFVDAVEVVSFGHSFFFRSLEKPKAFLVPTSDYEILEVREARMVLKNVGIDRSIKIGGGRDAAIRGGKEIPHEKVESSQQENMTTEPSNAGANDTKTERVDRKRDRRRGSRRRRGSPSAAEAAGIEGSEAATVIAGHPESTPQGHEEFVSGRTAVSTGANLTSMLTSLLPPPPTLISETIKRYKDNDLFRGAFFKESDEDAGEESSEQGFEQQSSEETAEPSIPLEQPAYGSFEATVEEEEAIYRERMKRLHPEEEAQSEPPAPTP